MPPFEVATDLQGGMDVEWAMRVHRAQTATSAVPGTLFGMDGTIIMPVHTARMRCSRFYKDHPRTSLAASDPDRLPKGMAGFKKSQEPRPFRDEVCISARGEPTAACVSVVTIHARNRTP